MCIVVGQHVLGKKALATHFFVLSTCRTSNYIARVEVL